MAVTFPTQHQRNDPWKKEWINSASLKLKISALQNIRMIRPATDWKKVLVKDIPDNGVILNILRSLKINKKTIRLKWAKDHNRHLTKENIQIEEAPQCMPPGKYKLKQDTTTPLLEWRKSRTLTQANAGEEFFFIADENAKWCTLKDN